MPGRMLVASAVELNVASDIVSSSMPSGAANAIMKLVPATW
jgi:hypothetical protein